jgi:hypothetical protein
LQGFLYERNENTIGDAQWKCSSLELEFASLEVNKLEKVIEEKFAAVFHGNVFEGNSFERK